MTCVCVCVTVTVYVCVKACVHVCVKAFVCMYACRRALGMCASVTTRAVTATKRESLAPEMFVPRFDLDTIGLQSSGSLVLV